MKFFPTLERGGYYVIVLPLIAFLPARIAYAIACLRGDLLHRLYFSRRNEIIRCLTSVFGDKMSLKECDEEARKFFRLRSCEAVDAMRLVGNGRALSRLVEIRGLENVKAALAAGKGALLCSGHFGSFDTSFSLLGSLGFPVTVVGRWPSRIVRKWAAIEEFYFGLVLEKQLGHHRRPNIEPRPKEFASAARIAYTLRKNELIGSFLDPPIYPEDSARSVRVNFLNGQALLLPGAISIARIIGAPVLMTFIYRSGDWYHQVLEISPPMRIENDISKAFQQCLTLIDSNIRRNPSHWLYWKPSALIGLGLFPEKHAENLGPLAEESNGIQKPAVERELVDR